MTSSLKYIVVRLSVLLLLGTAMGKGFGQSNTSYGKISKASKKIELALDADNKDSLAQGYFDLGESYYQKGDLIKSESFYQKSKTFFEKTNNADGIARSSRALAQVQEDLNKKKEAIANYEDAQKISIKTGSEQDKMLNGNDAGRLKWADSIPLQEKALNENLQMGLLKKDTAEVINGYTRLGTFNVANNAPAKALSAFKQAYTFSQNNLTQSAKINQLIADVYLKENNVQGAIETKKQLLTEAVAQGSTKLQASELLSLADLYLHQNKDSMAIETLHQSYRLSVTHGHTLEAQQVVNKLDSIFLTQGKNERRLALLKDFANQLPEMLSKDSSLTDEKLIAITEEKLQKLEQEKQQRDVLIAKKNRLNIWLGISVAALTLLVGIILIILKKSNRKNKQIALQSLRREMNPHFIFNSLNSINQFISTNNELAANQYLTRFSTLMRRVMENSKEDFVLLSREVELLQHYLELEKSRFPDKFDFSFHVADDLLHNEQLLIPGMLIQPHLENAIWHGLRYLDEKGLLKINFTRNKNQLQVVIDDNGIGISESKKAKTSNQKEHKGRGISNTLERISILNDLYEQQITCTITDKPVPDHGAQITLTMPIIKQATA